MRKQLESLIGAHVRMVQTGDIPVTGQLVAVNEDYASVRTDDERIICFPFAQIKSFLARITEMPASFEARDYTFPNTFYDLLETMLMQPIRVELGEGSKQGVLCKLSDELACIIINVKEMVYYPVCQIKNLTAVYETGKSTSSEDQRKEEERSAESGKDESSEFNAKSSGAANSKRSGHTGETSDAKVHNDKTQFNEKLARRMLEQLSVFEAQGKEKSTMKGCHLPGLSSKAPSLLHPTCRVRKPKREI